MMIKTREKRPATPMDVQKDLEEIIAGGTPKNLAADKSSSSPGPNTRLRRLTRGRRP
jgi:hypothetical protein